MLMHDSQYKFQRKGLDPAQQNSETDLLLLVVAQATTRAQ